MSDIADIRMVVLLSGSISRIPNSRACIARLIIIALLLWMQLTCRSARRAHEALKHLYMDRLAVLERHMLKERPVLRRGSRDDVPSA